MRTNAAEVDPVGRRAAPKRRATDPVAAPGPSSPAAVRALIEATVGGLGYELVDLQRAAHGLLRVTVDTMMPPGGIGLDDCERISRQLTHLLAVEQVDYERLEVASPGLDRPLMRPRDFVRFAGARIQLQLRVPLLGRRRFQGRLLGLDGESGAERVRFEVTTDAAAARGRAKAARVAMGQPQTLEVPLQDVEKARLIPMFDFRAGKNGDE